MRELRLLGAKGHGSAVGCGKRFLSLTGPMGRRVRKFDGPCGPKGCGIAHGGHWVARVQRVEVGACGAVGIGTGAVLSSIPEG